MVGIEHLDRLVGMLMIGMLWISGNRLEPLQCTRQETRCSQVIQIRVRRPSNQIRLLDAQVMEARRPGLQHFLQLPTVAKAKRSAQPQRNQMAFRSFGQPRQQSL